ncbi:MAG: formylglycine-generating enzyme family protein [Chloroflexi bacterium]|nr:formylglycine-generating enzyme family protein [Chloroflexota bacterium]
MKKRIFIVYLINILLVVLTSCMPAPSGSGLEAESTFSTPTIAEIVTEEPMPTATVEPEPTPEESTRIGTDGMELVLIPGGEFIMGWRGVDATIKNGPGPTADFMEFPMVVDEFWIDKYEVTNRQYKICVDAGGCRPFHQNNITPYGLDYFTDPTYDNYPVINVSWYMARDYCKWVGRRLLTEAEWERAARGDDGRKYPWGDEPYAENLANICDKDCPSSVRGEHGNPNFDDGFAGPAPVGSYPDGASPYGVMDMAGNVWEWTASVADPYPYDAEDGRESQYNIEDGSKWPERILRGGPWNGGYAYLRSSYRYRAVAIYWNMNMGIRCAQSK